MPDGSCTNIAGIRQSFWASGRMSDSVVPATPLSSGWMGDGGDKWANGGDKQRGSEVKSGRAASAMMEIMLWEDHHSTNGRSDRFVCSKWLASTLPARLEGAENIIAFYCLNNVGEILFDESGRIELSF